MSSRDLVKDTIHFRNPGRIPYMVLVDLARFEERREKGEVDEVMALLRSATYDHVIVDVDPADTWRPSRRPSLYEVPEWYSHDEREDEWGVLWKELRVIEHPLGAAWELSASYAVPDPDAPGRFDTARNTLGRYPDMYHLGRVWFTLFERLWMLRGFDNMLLDPYLHYDAFVDLRDRVMAYNLAIIQHWLELGIDGIYISDDWGAQSNLLINPDDWRRFYKPCYEQMISLAHKHNVDVWMHSCGHVTEIIPDLIEVGLDVLNPIQPQTMNLDQLSRDFAGKICFYGGVDVQGTLPRGTAADVREEVRKLIRQFRTDNGGYIGETSHTVLPDTPMANLRALFEAFDTYCSKPSLAWSEVEE